ncbi:MAG: guanylate kinase [Bacteroidetes bacterium]|nr:guanylate kinase [Bacteroidota bacterium]
MRNKAVIFCAPSGSGKTTIVKHLLNVNHDLMFSVSACTRKQRPNEVHGKDYYFINIDTFKQKIESHEFIEYEEVYGGNYYGTLKSEMERIWALNKTVIFDVDVEGGLNLKNYFGEQALAVFVKPPNIEELARRLRERSTETEEMLCIRVGKAVLELDYEPRFDIVLVNDILNNTLIKAEKLVTDFLKTIILNSK